MKTDIKLKLFILTIFSLLSFVRLCAQDDYKYEIGGGVGTAFYMGDANKTALYKNSEFAAGAVFRYNYDLNWSIKTDLAIGRLSGDTRTSGNAFPNGQHAKFQRTFYELGGQVEYNLFSYSDKFQYLGTKRFTPYVFTGVGMTYASGKKSVINLNIPMGIGLKYKWRDRLNIGFEFSFRKLFGDSFDVVSPKKMGDLNLDNPYNISSSFMKNKDWYVLTMFSVTWDFGVRVCPCLNLD